MQHAVQAAAEFKTQAAMPAATPPRMSEPMRIRFAAADLVRQGKLAEANLLTHEAMQHYPDSEDVLVMRALILQVMQDWSSARRVLERLLALQGDRAPAETWCHWIRVLRCEGLAQQAIEAASTAMAYFPGHPAINAELAQLQPKPSQEIRAA